MKGIYLARWKLTDAAQMQQALKKGLLTEEQAEATERLLAEFQQEKGIEGQPIDKELWTELFSHS